MDPVLSTKSSRPKPPPVISDYITRSRPLTKAILSSPPELHQNTDYFFYPPIIKKEELTHKQALKHSAADSCSIALDIKLTGLIDTLNALGPEPTDFADIPADAAIIPNKVFYKFKPSLPHKWKCRFVLGGVRQHIC